MKTALLTLAALASAVAFAPVAEARPAVHVSYVAGDLQNPARVARLEAAIERAAERVCGVNTARTLAERRAASACAAEAEARAEAELRIRVARAEEAAGRVRVAQAGR